LERNLLANQATFTTTSSCAKLKDMARRAIPNRRYTLVMTNFSCASLSLPTEAPGNLKFNENKHVGVNQKYRTCWIKDTYLSPKPIVVKEM
jgi:hypothetical protein